MKQPDYSQLPAPRQTARGTGTAYSLTATSAAIAFGTTSPAITLPEKGWWKLSGFVKLKYTGATFAAGRTVTIKFRRTNNTAADVGDQGTFTLLTGVITTITADWITLNIPPTPYLCTTEGDAITLFGDVSVLPSAGSLDITDAIIVADKVELP